MLSVFSGNARDPFRVRLEAFFTVRTFLNKSLHQMCKDLSMSMLVVTTIHILISIGLSTQLNEWSNKQFT
jgi:hypothetical protein